MCGYDENTEEEKLVVEEFPEEWCPHNVLPAEESCAQSIRVSHDKSEGNSLSGTP